MTSSKIGDVSAKVGETTPAQAPRPTVESEAIAHQHGVNPHATSEGVAVDYRVRPNADRIPCPALLSFYNNGALRPSADGEVSTEHLDAVLEGVGIGKAVRKILVRGADGTDPMPHCFNLFNLRDSNLDHTGSTGIRDPRVRPEKLPDLLKFSANGRLYTEHLAKAANLFDRQDPGFRGTAIQTAELTAILALFGRVDERGDRYLSTEDATGLWLRGEYPKGWHPPAKDAVGVGEVLGGGLRMALRRLWDGFLGFFRR